MIETTLTFAENMNPLVTFGVGVALGILTDEAGRAMFKKMANDRLDDVLGDVGDDEKSDEK